MINQIFLMEESVASIEIYLTLKIINTEHLHTPIQYVHFSVINNSRHAP